MRHRYLLVAGLLAAAPLSAQELTVGGELRPRFEVRDPVAGLAAGGETLQFTSMRTRAAIRAALGGRVRVLVQFQDVRTWGEEVGTMDYATAEVDLHQGWAELGDPAAGPWSLRVGRQELAYGDQRLIGAVNWAQQGRAFDGLRLRLRPTDQLAVDGLAMTIGNADAGGPRDEGLYGVYGHAEDMGLDGYVLYNTYNAAPSPLGAPDRTDQYTLGARWASGSDALDWRIEGAYQLGDRLNQDVSAYLLAVRVGRRLGGGLRAALWYDRLSGDDDPLDGETRVFDTLFATNHPLYGRMDLFTNIPAQTAGRGLQDIALKGSYDLREDVALNADAHGFFLTAAEGVSSSHVGEEVDLGARWGYAPGLTLSGGLSYFLVGDAWSGVLRNDDRNQVWGYIMLDAAFPFAQ